MSKGKKKKQKLRKEAEDEAKAREEAEVGYDTKIEAEEITDEDLLRITQKNEKTETHDHEKTNDKTLVNVKFLENDKTNDISHEHERSVEKREETEKKKKLKKVFDKSYLTVQNDIVEGNPINEQQFMKVVFLSLFSDTYLDDNGLEKIVLDGLFGSCD